MSAETQSGVFVYLTLLSQGDVNRTPLLASPLARYQLINALDSGFA